MGLGGEGIPGFHLIKYCLSKDNLVVQILEGGVVLGDIPGSPPI